MNPSARFTRLPDTHRPRVRRMEGWVFPGEYESHQAIWLLSPTYENKAGFPSTPVIGDIIHAISGHTHVNLAVQDRATTRRRRGVLLSAECRWTTSTSSDRALDLWGRDMGPQFTRSLRASCASTTGASTTGVTRSQTACAAFRRAVRSHAASLIDVPSLEPDGSHRRAYVHEGGSVPTTDRGR